MTDVKKATKLRLSNSDLEYLEYTEGEDIVRVATWKKGEGEIQYAECELADFLDFAAEVRQIARDHQ